MSCLELAVCSLDCDDLRRAEILQSRISLRGNRELSLKVMCSGLAPRTNSLSVLVSVTSGTCMHAPFSSNHLRPLLTPARKGNQVHGRRPYEISNEQTGRTIVNFLRRAQLLDRAVVHDGDKIGQGHGLELIVGHVNRGCADAIVELAQFFRSSSP